MSDIAIRVEHLSKRYRLGQRERAAYRTLREAVSDVFLSPLRRLRTAAQRANVPTCQRENGYIWALRDVSFEVKQGEVLGIIGRNGAGKTTLLKILSRITEPTEGYAEIHGRVGSLLEVGTGFHPELTGRENIYLNGAILGMKKAEIDRYFDEIVEFAEIEKFLDTPVKRYSSGMYVRLAFAVAAHLQPEILLVDEVLAVGDAAFQMKCLGKMGDIAKAGRTVLFVSHNMAAIRRLCDRVLVLDSGQIAVSANAAQGVARYLQLVSAEITDGLNVAARDGDGPLRFVSFHLEDESGRQVQNLMAGQNVRLILKYISPIPVPTEHGFEVSIVLRAADGTCVSNLSTYYFDLASLVRIPARGELECHVPRLPLRSGTYWVDLYCAVGHSVSDHLHHAAKFTVIDGDYFGSGRVTQHETGVVFIDHKWSVRPAQEA